MRKRYLFARRSPPPAAAVAPEDAAQAAHRRRSVAATVNGHDIKPYAIDGGGIVFRIDGTEYPTMAAAEAAAYALPARDPMSAPL